MTLRIRELRKAAGLKQIELAARCGVSPALLNMWERGACRPTIDALPGLAAALGVTIGALFGETEGGNA